MVPFMKRINWYGALMKRGNSNRAETNGKKLVLSKQTIRELKPGELAHGVGGTFQIEIVVTSRCDPKC
jgi:hypothetical protein